MLNITINAPRAFTDVEINIVAAASEKLSQFATMFHDAEIQEPMEKYVNVKHDDFLLVEVEPEGLCPVPVATDVTQSEFICAMQLALHTTVTFAINTPNGSKQVTRQLCPGLLDDAGTFAWSSEPDFIFELNDENQLEFTVFDALKEFVTEDIHCDEVVTTMIAGGKTVWSV